ncbi:MAG: hypothetical protein ACREUM_00930, partial [Nitrosospira sp.]
MIRCRTPGQQNPSHRNFHSVTGNQPARERASVIAGVAPPIQLAKATPFPLYLPRNKNTRLDAWHDNFRLLSAMEW